VERNIFDVPIGRYEAGLVFTLADEVRIPITEGLFVVEIGCGQGGYLFPFEEMLRARIHDYVILRI